MSSDFRLTWAAKTSVGLVRTRNEDAYLAMEKEGVFGVADGMGGHKRGDLAAQLCLGSVHSWFQGTIDETAKKEFLEIAKSFGKARDRRQRELVAAVELAHQVVRAKGESSPKFKGMGTTVVLARFHGRWLLVAYVGDSRIYRFRRGRLRQLSEDHSLLNEYIRLSVLDPRDADRFPYRNIIMRAIGLGEVADADTFKRRVRDQDVYLLCTDGLTDLVSDEEIAHVLGSVPELGLAADALVAAALERGGTDNVTVLLVRAQVR